MGTKTLQLMVTTLKQKLHNLPEHDQQFAASFISQYERKLDLSEKQQYWVDKLIQKAGSSTEQHSSPVEEIFDGSHLLSHFQKAAKFLKYPKLKMQTPSGKPILFYISGQRSKTPGIIVITNGKQYPNRILYGTVESTGTGELIHSTNSEIKTYIRRVAVNPTEEAKQLGIRVSSCCFCGLELTNSISVFHGYGPICAAHWGLPWEGSAEETEKVKEQEKLAQLQLIDLDPEAA